MRRPDRVLAAVPLSYLIAALGLLPFDAHPSDAVFLGSIAAIAVIAHALFVNPPQ